MEKREGTERTSLVNSVSYYTHTKKERKKEEEEEETTNILRQTERRNNRHRQREIDLVFELRPIYQADRQTERQKDRKANKNTQSRKAKKRSRHEYRQINKHLLLMQVKQRPDSPPPHPPK